MQVTLSCEFSRDGLEELRHRVDDLLAALTHPLVTPHAGPAEGVLAARKVQLLWERLADKSRAYLVACSGLANEFTIDQIAQVMGETGARVQAFHRNVARAAAATDPTGVRLIISRRQGAQTRLHMPAEIRHAVQDAAAHDHP